MAVNSLMCYLPGHLPFIGKLSKTFKCFWPKERFKMLEYSHTRVSEWGKCILVRSFGEGRDNHIRQPQLVSSPGDRIWHWLCCCIISGTRYAENCSISLSPLSSTRLNCPWVLSWFSESLPAATFASPWPESPPTSCHRRQDSLFCSPLYWLESSS